MRFLQRGPEQFEHNRRPDSQQAVHHEKLPGVGQKRQFVVQYVAELLHLVVRRKTVQTVRYQHKKLQKQR